MKIDKPDHQWWRAIDESVGSLLDSRHWQFRSFPKETSLWPTRYLSKSNSKLVSCILPYVSIKLTFVFSQISVMDTAILGLVLKVFVPQMFYSFNIFHLPRPSCQGFALLPLCTANRYGCSLYDLSVGSSTFAFFL